MYDFNQKAVNFFERTEEGLRSFDIIDFGILALGFSSLGYIFGAIKRKFKKTFAPFFAFLTFLSFAYVIIKIFFKNSVPYQKIRR